MFYQRKVAFHTLGCKLNYAETSSISRNLQDYGFEKTDFNEYADFYIINTCSVTENADKECKQIVKNVLKSNPSSKIVIIGCYAQLKPQEISAIPGVSLVLGTKEKFNLHTHLEKLENSEDTLVLNSPIDQVSFFQPSYSVGERTRSFLKVQDGCDYHCSFCTIPLARGNSRSQSIDNTLKVANEVAQTGVKEIVLTGVNIGDYGKNPEGTERTKETFYDLVKSLDEIEGINRFRISSIEPNLLSPEIVNFVSKSKRFTPHFHIPLQSGSDRILKYMRRKYLTPLYKERIEYIKKVMPHCCIGVDVIVGFPGETDEEFDVTKNFIEQLDISYLHVFSYSERTNTKALDYTPIVPLTVRKERSRILRQLSETKKKLFYSQFENSISEVLWESSESDGFIYGFTNNYIKVKAPANSVEPNSISKVLLLNTEKEGIMTCKTELSVNDKR